MNTEYVNREIDDFVKDVLDIIKGYDNIIYDDLAKEWFGKVLKERIDDNLLFASEIRYTHRFISLLVKVKVIFGKDRLDIFINWKDSDGDEYVDGKPIELDFRKAIALNM